MRFYRPPKLCDNDTCAETHYVVLSQTIRGDIPEIGHGRFGGYLRMKKTYSKLFNDFTDQG